ncbi:hypothetical protein BDW69DRAFT_165013 [Aspergillus filifer]
MAFVQDEQIHRPQQPVRTAPILGTRSACSARLFVSSRNCSYRCRSETGDASLLGDEMQCGGQS